METITTPPASGMASQAAQPGNLNPAPTMGAGENSRLAEIIRRRDAGEKLTASERGYLGAQLKKQMAKVPKPAPSAAPNLLLEPQPESENPLLNSSPAAGAEAPVADTPFYNPADIRAAAEGIFTGLDEATKAIIADQVASLGGDSATVERWRQAVAMKGAKPLMVEGSEPVIIGLCKLFKCDPQKLVGTIKGGGFLSGATIWLLGVRSAIREIKSLSAQRPKPEEKKA